MVGVLAVVLFKFELSAIGPFVFGSFVLATGVVVFGSFVLVAGVVVLFICVFPVWVLVFGLLLVATLAFDVLAAVVFTFVLPLSGVSRWRSFIILF